MCWILDSSLVLGLQLKILICGVAAEQQQQQQTVCGSACHKWCVLINTSALFSVFLPFLFWLFEKKCHGAKSVKTGSVYFHTWTAVDYYASPKGDKIEKKIYKKTPLLGAQHHQTKVWTWCLSKPHTKISTWVQLFVIILQPGCQHLGNFSSCWYQSNVRKKKGSKANHAHFCCRGCASAAWIAPWSRGQKSHHHRMPFCCCAAWKESSTFSTFPIFAITAAASALHACRMYGITP